MESGIAASPMPWHSGEGGLKYPLGSHGSVKWHPAALQGQHAVHSHTWEEVDACDGNDCGGNPAGVAASSPLGNHFPLHLLGRASPIFGTQRTLYRRTGHTPATAVSAAVVLAAWRTCACAGGASTCASARVCEVCTGGARMVPDESFALRVHACKHEHARAAYKMCP